MIIPRLNLTKIDLTEVNYIYNHYGCNSYETILKSSPRLDLVWMPSN